MVGALALFLGVVFLNHSFLGWIGFLVGASWYFVNLHTPNQKVAKKGQL